MAVESNHIVGIVLAAGASRRMGSPKALLPLPSAFPRANPEPPTLLETHVEVLHRRCGRVLVVTGAEDERLRAALDPSILFVHNSSWAESDPATSLRMAMAGLPDDTWAVITPVDAPPVPGQVLDALLTQPPPVIPTWNGRRGHPVCVRVGDVRTRLEHATLRDILAEDKPTELPVRWPGTVLNLNTPDAWSAWLNSDTSTHQIPLAPDIDTQHESWCLDTYVREYDAEAARCGRSLHDSASNTLESESAYHASPHLYRRLLRFARGRVHAVSNAEHSP